MQHTIYLGLGTNLGDRGANLRTAIERLAPEVHALAVSSVYRTTPWGYENQPEFLNQVVHGLTALDPHGLLNYIKDIETTMGREETFRYGPRLIDIDILLYDDLVLDSPMLTLPHPGLPERAFVLVPLAELAPNLLHPETHRTIQTMLAEIGEDGVERVPQDEEG